MLAKVHREQAIKTFLTSPESKRLAASPHAKLMLWVANEILKERKCNMDLLDRSWSDKGEWETDEHFLTDVRGEATRIREERSQGGG
ncbi:MAG: hypothetical protein AAB590_03995 [Patescibacteria group bacterium]